MKKITLTLIMLFLYLCSYAQLPLQGFETWPPAGWIIADNGNGLLNSWTQSSGGPLPAYEGSHAAYINRENVTGIAEDWLITPEFTAPASPQLRFYSRLTSNGDDGSLYRIYVYSVATGTNPAVITDPGYTEIQEWTELEINPIQQEYIEKIVDIPAEYAGQQVRIAFVMAGDDGDRWLVDNVRVAEECLPPHSLEAQNISLNGAELSWAPGAAGSWEVEVIKQSQLPTGNGSGFTGPFPYIAAGLDPGTEYKFYVRAVCEDGIKSEWAGPVVFTTPNPGDSCSTPYVVQLPFMITGNTATAPDNYIGFPGTGCGNSEWEDYLSGNDIVFEYTASFTGAISIDLLNNGQNSGLFVYGSCDDIGDACLAGGVSGFVPTPVSVPEFQVTAGESYYIVISSYQVQATPYTLVIQQVTCEPPVGLPPSDIAETSVQLSWTNPVGASAWQIVVQDPGMGIPQGAGENVTGTPAYLAGGLTEATPYEYYVRAACGDGTFSAWSGPYFFHTTICQPQDQCTYVFTMNNTFAWTENTMTVSQNGIPVAVIGPTFNAPGPVDVEVQVCDGMPFQLYWNDTGNFEQEIGISVQNPFGQIVYNKPPGEGTQGSLLYTGTGHCGGPECLPPSNLTASGQTMTSAQLGWAGPSSGEWEVYITNAGQPAPVTATPGESVTSNPFIATGLDPATNYQYYVRFICDNGEPSAWSEPFAFSTAVCDATEQCLYTFNLTSEWWSGWEGSVMTVTQNGANVAVIGPTFTSGGSELVTVPMCHGIPFEIFWTNGGNSAFQTGLTVVNPFDQVIFSKPAETGEPGTVLYSGTANCLLPECLPPTGLTAGNTGMDSAELSWDNTPGTWEYYVVQAGQPAPGNDTVGVAAGESTVTVNSLTPATAYEYYVRTVCTGAASEHSPWTGPYLFYTEVCPPEDKCTFTFEMTTLNGWSGWEGNTMTLYQQGIPVATIGPGFDFFGTSATEEISLCGGMDVELVWNNGGSSPEAIGLVIYSPFLEDIYTKPPGVGSQGTTLYTGTPSCSPPVCPKPQDIVISDITSSSATINWEEPGSATSWEVAVLPMGSPAPTGAGTAVAGKPFLYEGLEPGHAYVVYVRANCGDNGYSGWAGPAAFVTVLQNDECSGAIPVPVNSGLVCEQVATGTITGSTFSGLQPACSGNPIEHDVWFSFTATSARHSVDVNQNNFGGYFYHAVYEGDDCGNLTLLSCESQISIMHNLTPGTTYYIQVYTDPINPPGPVTSFDLCVRTPGTVITVSDTEYTTDELVTDVLIDAGCGSVSNISSSGGLDYDSSNSIGYFDQNDSAFPLEEGVILATGGIAEAPGPYREGPYCCVDSATWGGDEDLDTVMENYGLTGDTYNASSLEFDLVPYTTSLSFPFIFASSEYLASCTRYDTFAILITGPDGITHNMAVVPGTDTPVSSGTVRGENEICMQMHPEYFDKFNSDQDFNPTSILSQINYIGQTVVMHAQADVVPGQVYHIKMVIQEHIDAVLNAAVFIGKANFIDPALALPGDMTVENRTAICDGGEVELNIGIEEGPYDIKWFRNGEQLEGVSGTTYTVVQEGTYSVEVTYTGTDCSHTEEVVIEYYPPLETTTGDPSDIAVCSNNGFATFDLSPNVAAVLAGQPDPQNFTVTFHTSQQNAQNNVSAITGITAFQNTQQWEQPLYMRIVYNPTGCIGYKTFNVVVPGTIPDFDITGDLAICSGAEGTLMVDAINFDPLAATYSWSVDGNVIPGSAPAIIITAAGNYEVTVTNGTCTATKSVNVVIAPSPVADAPADVTVCDSYELPALTVGNYYTGPGGTGAQLPAGTPVTASQSIYVYASNGSCSDENSFSVSIVNTPVAAITQGCEDDNYIVEVVPEDNSSSDISVVWQDEAGNELGSGESLVVDGPGIYYAVVTPLGTSLCPVVLEAEVITIDCLIPRGISPNSDGRNDSFDLTALNVKQLSIFNRFGRLVYSKSNYRDEWHGQADNGDELPAGTYFYTIEYAGGRGSTGWVYINR